ncbi:TPA: hypothetical protein HA265_00330 [Candidatus Woesearchaeota archaeon]|nr:hypothetical protein [Candidatus Woesearchaeota archaeon]
MSALPSAFAIGIGVVPNSLIFDSPGAEGSFRIMNPNPFEIEFSLKNPFFDFEPSKGTILPGSDYQVTAYLKEGLDDSSAATDSIILVETVPLGDVGDAVGMLPAVGVKARILSAQGASDKDVRLPGAESVDSFASGSPEEQHLSSAPQKTEEIVKPKKVGPGAGPLAISDNGQHDIITDEPIFRKGELIAIACLVVAIIGVALYPYSQNEKKSKKVRPKKQRKTKAKRKNSSRRIRLKA